MTLLRFLSGLISNSIFSHTGAEGVSFSSSILFCTSFSNLSCICGGFLIFIFLLDPLYQQCPCPCILATRRAFLYAQHFSYLNVVVPLNSIQVENGLIPGRQLPNQISQFFCIEAHL